MRENSHLHALRHKHLTYFDSAFVYICRNKIYAWKPFAENESNFKNSQPPRCKCLPHAFLLNTLAVGILRLLLMALDPDRELQSLPCGVHLLVTHESGFTLFGLQKIKSHDKNLRAFAEVSSSFVAVVSVSSEFDAISEDAISPPGGPDGVQGFILHIFCFTHFT